MAFALIQLASVHLKWLCPACAQPATHGTAPPRNRPPIVQKQALHADGGGHAFRPISARVRPVALLVRVSRLSSTRRTSASRWWSTRASPAGSSGHRRHFQVQDGHGAVVGCSSEPWQERCSSVRRPSGVAESGQRRRNALAGHRFAALSCRCARIDASPARCRAAARVRASALFCPPVHRRPAQPGAPTRAYRRATPRRRPGAATARGAPLMMMFRWFDSAHSRRRLSAGSPCRIN